MPLIIYNLCYITRLCWYFWHSTCPLMIYLRLIHQWSGSQLWVVNMFSYIITGWFFPETLIISAQTNVLDSNGGLKPHILRIILVTIKVWLKCMLKLSVVIFIIAPVNEHTREVFLCLPLLSSFIMSNFIWLDVWEHFKKGEKVATYCHCLKELSYCEGMTNLSDHRMRIHPLKYTAVADKNKVSTAKIDTFIKNGLLEEPCQKDN